MTEQHDADPKPPPTTKLLLYRAGSRLPAEYRAWVERDLADPRWALKDAVGYVVSTAIYVTVFYLLITAFDPARGSFPVTFMATMLALFLTPYAFPAYRNWRRKRSLARHRALWRREPHRAGPTSER